MSELNNDQEDPYRSPHEVSESKSSANKWGWRRLAVFAFVVVLIGMAGLLLIRPTTRFNMQRAPPILRDAPPTIRSSVEKGEPVSDTDSPPDTAGTQIP
jgi:hypothetical protein